MGDTISAFSEAGVIITAIIALVVIVWLLSSREDK